MSTTHDYEYIPLEDPEIWIRLLRLCPLTDDHPELRGELITCRREEAPPYQPVSYTWGQQDPTSTIFLRNDEKFHIRPNLEALLQQFRTLPSSKVFWVDAICIDQTNNNEKGHQVRNMDKIYKDKHLLIWLGEPTDDSNVVLDLIEAFDPQSASTWKAFRRFMRRPWFARRWIVQEFILSDHKDACVGNRWFCFNSIVVICYRIQNQHC
ncbi:hypothetical protein K456DRAFT_1836221 [Colletotrichum gloeosporioides 23]|nr:hypothetical protein K456DRAFT_1836221 [Colletotrichum gloeosporioides 23]